VRGRPRAKRAPPEGVLSPRARRTSLEGRLLRHPGGPQGPPGSWLCCVCALGVRVDLCFAFFACFKRGSPWFFRGPLGLSPTARAGDAARAERAGGGDLLLWGHVRRPAQGDSAVRAQKGPHTGLRRAERVGSGHRLGPIQKGSFFGIYF
jgi:hypothetical protein